MIPPKYWSPTKKLMVLGAMAGGKLVEDTATGNPLKFITDKAKPLKSLLIPFTPVQSGTGDPSPQNIRSILPRNGLTVWNGGKNLFDKATAEVHKSSVSQGAIGFASNGVTVWIPCKPNTTYTVRKVPTNRSTICYANTDREPENGDSVYGVKVFQNRTYETITTGADATWLVLYANNNTYDETPVQTVLDSIQIEVGNTATAYEPYKPITETDISFPSPVYGGNAEIISGALSGTWGAKKVKDIEWTYNAQNTRFVGTIEDIKLYPAVRTTPFYASVFVSVDDGREISSVPNNAVYGGTNSTTIYVKCEDYTDPEDFITAYGEQVICYPLEKPQTVQLTPAQITAIVGDNTIWSDADGSMTAVYLKKG